MITTPVCVTETAKGKNPKSLAQQKSKEAQKPKNIPLSFQQRKNKKPLTFPNHHRKNSRV
jgi:hypothetical protein